MEAIKGKNILIVCYGFPPNPGVAGRRWAKFAKYLKRDGYNVSVVAAINKSSATSEWINDVDGVSVEYLPLKYPDVLTKKPTKFIAKLKYRFWLLILPLIYRGNYYDRTIFWKSQLKQVLGRKITNESIDTVIVTSGPFILSYYVIKLKAKFPKVQFISDYRDLWTEDKEITSFSGLSKRRVNYEKHYERKTVLMSDAVLTVADTMTDYFGNFAVNKPVFTLPNGYDPEDMIDENVTRTDNKIKLVFAGTLYINLFYILEPFFKEIRNICQNDEELATRLSVEFYGFFPDEYKLLINKYQLAPNVKVYGKLSLKETILKIKSADLCLLFLNDTYRFALSTKFCEYVSHNKKIIVCANNGPTSDFIEKHKLGYSITPDAFSEKLLPIINQYRIQPSKELFDETQIEVIKQFSLPVLTTKLRQILSQTKTETSYPKYTRNLLLTFDYELFLGTNSGSVENCMLKPTLLLLDLLDKHQIKNAIFFVDTTYLYQMEKNLSLDIVSTDYEKVINQLVDILKRGHYIFPHLHPHWLDAVYDEGTNRWKHHQFGRYRFSTLEEDTKLILFNHAITLIKKVQITAQRDYVIDGYRAGGLCIQPFTAFKKYFDMFGIKNEFSVLGGYKNDKENFYFNFEEAPLRGVYKFTEEIDCKDNFGSYTEYQISTVKLKNYAILKSRLLTKLLVNKKYKKTFGDGFSAVKSDENFIEDSKFKFSFFQESDEEVSMDFLTKYKANRCLKKMKKDNYIHFISHPKVFSEYGLKVFDDFLAKANSKYKLNTDYRKIN